MTIYDKIESSKKELGYNNRILGEVVGKSEAAFGAAMRRKSLSDLEIKELEIFLQEETKNSLQDSRELEAKIISILEASLNRADAEISRLIQENERLKNN